MFLLATTHQTLTLLELVVSLASVSADRPNIEQLLHSPRQVLHCIALPCLCLASQASTLIHRPEYDCQHAHTHDTHTPRRRPDLSAPPPPPINPLCRRRRLPPSDLPYVCCLLQQKRQHPLATRRSHRLMLRNQLRLLHTLPADAPSVTGIGFGQAACLAT